MTDFNRLNDVYFKSLFTNEHNKQIAICFLNDILDRQGEKAFTNIEFLDKENQPSIEAGKVSILDIRAKMNDDTEINIEVQVQQREDMAKRSLYYWSKIYSSQLMKKDPYITLNDTIAINLLKFDFLPYANYHNVYHIINDETHDRLLDDFEMHFIELPKFRLGDIRKLRKSDKWAALFSNRCTTKELEEIAMSEPAIKKALEYEKYFNQNPTLRRQYELREMAERDYTSGIYLAEQRGRQRGIQQGLQQGIKQEKVSNALNLLKLGVSPEIVADGVGLKLAEVLAIQAKI